METQHRDFHTMTLTDAIYNTIHRHPTKSVRQIAEEAGMSASCLYKAGLPPEENGGNGCDLQARRIAPVVIATGDFQILDHIEYQVHRAAFMLPWGCVGVDSIYRQAMKVAEEFGHQTATISKALRDSKVTKDEIPGLRSRILHQLRASMTLLAQLEEVAR